MTFVEGTGEERRSLEEVHGTVHVPSVRRSWWRQAFAFLGPAYLVSVGYMDPGNWATDLEGGARFGYALIWVLLMSNLMAVLLQTLAARLGVVTGLDLAQACRVEYSRRVNIVLWLLAEVAIAATDLAEVLGTIIALKLLFGMPLLWGCLVTAFDTFLLLWLAAVWDAEDGGGDAGPGGDDRGVLSRRDLHGSARDGGRAVGFAAELAAGGLFVAIGILGATVMPHNLYLHSALVQSRRIGTRRREQGRSACRYNLLDSTIALNAAFFVNAAILVLSAAVFHRNGVEVASIEEAYRLLPSFLGGAAADPVRRRPAVRGAELDRDRHARRPDRDGGVSRPEGRSLAAPAGHAAGRAGAGGGGDLGGGRRVDAAAHRAQPGDPEPAAFVRGDPADPLHLEPAEHGDVRDAVVGPGARLADGRGDRLAQREARAGQDRGVGRRWRRQSAIRVGPLPLSWLVARRSLRPDRGLGRACWHG